MKMQLIQLILGLALALSALVVIRLTGCFEAEVDAVHVGLLCGGGLLVLSSFHLVEFADGLWIRK